MVDYTIMLVFCQPLFWYNTCMLVLRGDYMLFGEGMKLERKRLKLSQKELSIKSGIPQQTISAIECGTSEPTEHTMVMVADGLGCTVGRLLGEYEIKNSPSGSPDELNAIMAEIMTGLSPADFQRVLDFVAGLKAARKEPPFP
jgi:transcriptional regulator with XRE-family HTH domain